MASSFKTYGELVRMAYEGSLQLPAFQRGWRWGPAKVRNLIDSLRQGYPIGALLFLQGSNEELSPRVFQGAHADAKNKVPEYLVLDGQQRLTAGIQIFYPDSKGHQYFVDLNKLKKLLELKGTILDEEKDVEIFASSIDHQDGYIISRKGGGDPRAQLLNKNLVATSILADKKKFSQARDDYLEANPDQRKIFSRLIEPYFCSFGADSIPVIEIPTHTGLDSIARIFTTLNTTGQLLTPFELVVAKLYPHGIELDREVADLKSSAIYYSRMDSTGEILLQTIAMLGGKEPKKANLPKTITGPLYLEHKEAAFQALDALGKFLTEQLGAGLDAAANESLVPYDAVYAPMAVALREVRTSSLSSAKRTRLERALEQWYVASALSQRYQEGVHNKQENDLRDFRLLISGQLNELPMLNGITFRRLLKATPAGAIGKLVKGLLNMQHPKDPATEKLVGFASNATSTEKHHIFATRWCSTGLQKWVEGENTNDLALNMMLVEEKTNKRWVNFSPADQIKDCIVHGRTQARVKEIYASQHIPSNAFEILQKENLSVGDFETFLLVREAAIHKFIKDRFGLDVSSTGADELESDDEVA